MSTKIIKTKIGKIKTQLSKDNFDNNFKLFKKAHDNANQNFKTITEYMNRNDKNMKELAVLTNVIGKNFDTILERFVQENNKINKKLKKLDEVK